MIPKIIHYCWFGRNPLSELAIKCIESWKKHCPDYEIIEWNETNFDINYNNYVKEAYEAKKWAFVSDVARFYALVDYGGIYMDTDVEVVKPLNDLLSLEAFSGFESEDRIAAGILGCKKGHSLFVDMLNSYNSDRFLKDDGEYDFSTIVSRLTSRCQSLGFVLNNKKQSIDGVTIFPIDYFYSEDMYTGKLNITKNTYTIHYYSGSWLPPESKAAFKYRKILLKFLPKKVACRVAQFVGETKVKGLHYSTSRLAKWIKRRLKGV